MELSYRRKSVNVANLDYWRRPFVGERNHQVKPLTESSLRLLRIDSFFQGS